DFGNEVTFVGGSEHGSAEAHDSLGGVGVENQVAAGGEDTFIAVKNADDLPVQFGGGTNNRTDHRIQAGAIAAAGQHTYSFLGHNSLKWSGRFEYGSGFIGDDQDSGRTLIMGSVRN